MMSILMNFILSCVHLRHIAEDVSDLTLRPVMILIHFLMQTDEELAISHQASLSCVLSRGMGALLMGGARVRLTNVPAKRVLRKYFFIEGCFALGISIKSVLKHFNWRNIRAMISLIRLEVDANLGADELHDPWSIWLQNMRILSSIHQRPEEEVRDINWSRHAEAI